jgi:hypothetical protein
MSLQTNISARIQAAEMLNAKAIEHNIDPETFKQAAAAAMAAAGGVICGAFSFGLGTAGCAAVAGALGQLLPAGLYDNFSRASDDLGDAISSIGEGNLLDALENLANGFLQIVNVGNWQQHVSSIFGGEGPDQKEYRLLSEAMWDKTSENLPKLANQIRIAETNVLAGVVMFAARLGGGKIPALEKDPITQKFLENYQRLLISHCVVGVDDCYNHYLILGGSPDNRDVGNTKNKNPLSPIIGDHYLHYWGESHPVRGSRNDWMPLAQHYAADLLRRADLLNQAASETMEYAMKLAGSKDGAPVKAPVVSEPSKTSGSSSSLLPILAIGGVGALALMMARKRR